MSLNKIIKVDYMKDFEKLNVGQKVLIEGLEQYFVGRERRKENNLYPIIISKNEKSIIEKQITHMYNGEVFDYNEKVINKNDEVYEFYKAILEEKK